MAYQMTWLVEEHVIYSRITGTAPEERAQFNNDALALLEQSGKPLVHFILDLQHAVFKPSLPSIRSNYTFPSHPRFGWAVIVGVSNPLLRTTLSIAPQLFKARFRHFDTLDEGFHFLQFIDSTVPELTQFLERIPDAE